MQQLSSCCRRRRRVREPCSPKMPRPRTSPAAHPRECSGQCRLAPHWQRRRQKFRAGFFSNIGPWILSVWGATEPLAANPISSVAFEDTTDHILTRMGSVCGWWNTVAAAAVNDVYSRLKSSILRRNTLEPIVVIAVWQLLCDRAGILFVLPGKSSVISTVFPVCNTLLGLMGVALWRPVWLR